VALGPEQVAALAPDAGALAAARKTADRRRWLALGQDEQAVWGECQGSALYQVRVALDDLTASCSCPSRKLPCKHALALLLLAVDGLPPAAPPDWVAGWLARRAPAERKRGDLTNPGANPDLAGRARRAQKRAARITAGVEGLERWMADLVRSGLASTPQGDEAWYTQAARLVDAQAPGLASRVRQLGGFPRTGEGWAERLAGGLGRLALLCQAVRRQDALDGGLAAEIRTAVGWTLDRAEVIAAGEHLRDRWAVVGQVVIDDERMRTQRAWLRGLGGGREALILQFAAGEAGFAETLVPGTVLDAELAFWPGSAPLRALVAERHGAASPLLERPAATGVEEMLEAQARALARQPWIDRFPAALAGVVPARRGEAGFVVADARGRALPLRGSPWKLLAVSGGHPVDLFGEWDGHTLRPLGAIAEERFHPLEEDSW
jgi:hypothetical protein